MSVPRRKSINPFAGLDRSAKDTPSTPNDTSSRPSSSRASIVRLPDATSLPSRSASTPFDWDALRSGGPPPYASSPLQRRSKKRVSLVPLSSTDSKGKPSGKRVIRRRPLIERALNYPSQKWFEFQESLSLLEERSVGRTFGGLAHLLHFISRWSYLRTLRETNVGWYDMYEESVSWFHWTFLLSCCLIVISFLVSFYLFTRVRIYRLHHHMKPGEVETCLVESPHARFVGDKETFNTMEEPSPWTRAWTFSKHLVLTCWLFFINQDTEVTPRLRGGKYQIQELQVWSPKAAEKAFFTIYSPAHGLLWVAWNFDSWLLVMVIMGFFSFLLNLLVVAYEYLIKDKAILSSELMNEYDQKFVNPRVFAIHQDVSTQTHEAEMVISDNWSFHINPVKAYQTR